MAEKRIRVDAAKLRTLAAKILQGMGVPEKDARITAAVLVAADLRGIETHGIVSLVPFYVTWIKEGRINPTPDIKITGTGQSVATMDGDRGLGFAVTHRAMEEAISRAEKTGAGFVAVGNSTHFGPAFYYSMMALEHDMIGITLTCSAVAEVVAPGSSIPAVGTNPISVAAPAGKRPPFVLDMATSVVAAGKLRKAMLEGKSLPIGWALDKDGNPLTDPNKRVLGEGGLLPLGGTPELGVFKGFGLGVAVDILTSLLAGLPPAVLKKNAGTSHFVGALRIASFLPVASFKDAMDEMIDAYAALPKYQGVQNISVAGALEDEIQKERESKGIPLLPKVIQTLKETALELGVEYDM